jgi:hypothetical protein
MWQTPNLVIKPKIVIESHIPSIEPKIRFENQLNN